MWFTVWILSSSTDGLFIYFSISLSQFAIFLFQLMKCLSCSWILAACNLLLQNSSKFGIYSGRPQAYTGKSNSSMCYVWKVLATSLFLSNITDFIHLTGRSRFSYLSLNVYTYYLEEKVEASMQVFPWCHLLSINYIQIPIGDLKYTQIPQITHPFLWIPWPS